MLINLSNHPVARWSIKQLDAANNIYNSVTDIEFPRISPDAELEDIIELSRVYYGRIELILKQYNLQNNAVHIMGEFTFTFNLLEKLRQNNVSAVASTTVRNISMDEKGNKISVFEFVKFRRYY